jgi:hypothetical protein
MSVPPERPALKNLIATCGAEYPIPYNVIDRQLVGVDDYSAGITLNRHSAPFAEHYS